MANISSTVSDRLSADIKRFQLKKVMKEAILVTSETPAETDLTSAPELEG